VLLGVGGLAATFTAEAAPPPLTFTETAPKRAAVFIFQLFITQPLFHRAQPSPPASEEMPVSKFDAALLLRYTSNAGWSSLVARRAHKPKSFPLPL
jgi:hypothetical protein